MKRHTYLNTAHATSKDKYVEDMKKQYAEWKEDVKNKEIELFVESIKKRYDTTVSENNPFVRCTLSITNGDKHVKFHQYGTLLYTLLAAISDATHKADIKISTRKDGVFVENIKRYEGGEIMLRAHIEILDDEARKVWEDGGDDALDEFLLKDKESHIINDRYDTLCDRVLV